MTQLLTMFDPETAGSSVPTWGVVIFSLGFALGLAAVMFATFKRVHSKMSYDENYNIMLVMLAIVSTILMQLIQSNLALSLGMLGSLSLVRFRTNIKDPRDIGFVFWAMGIGIAASSQAFFIGIAGSVLLAVLMVWSSNNSVASNTMLIVIRGSQANAEKITDTVASYSNTSRVKAHNLLADSFELVYEIRASEKNQVSLAEHVKEFEGVDTVNLLALSAEMA